MIKNEGYSVKAIKDKNKESKRNLALGYAGIILSTAAYSILVGSGIGTIAAGIGVAIAGTINGISIIVAQKGHNQSNEVNDELTELEEFMRQIKK